MTGVPGQDDLEARVARLEQAIHALSTAPRAAHTSITDADGNEIVRLSADGMEWFSPDDGTRRASLDGEQLVFYDPSGAATVILGKVAWTDLDMTRIEQGIVIQRTDGRDMFDVGANGRGIIRPRLTYQPRALNVSTPVTSGAFTPVWQFIIPGIPSNSVRIFVAVGCDPGTTGDVRCEISGVTTSLIPCAAGVVTNADFKWHLEAAGIDIGSTFFLNVEARRTGGAGNVNVHMPWPARTWDDLSDGADADGIFP